MNNSTNKQKKLLICADSFCAGANQYNWTWWHRLAKDLNCEVKNLSISGASNFNIFLQLEEGLKYNPDYILISLTAPNRIEEKLTQENINVTYNDLLQERMSSWAVHERIERKEISIEVGDKFFDYNVNKRKDELIIESILERCKDMKSLVLANLFDDCIIDSLNYDIVPKNYCDVVTGQLDEPEAGHVHKTYHSIFYDDNRENFLKHYEAD